MSGYTIRVLHFLHTFLNLTENWIYPQIARTPGTNPRVYCTKLANRAQFPLSPRSIYIAPPDPRTLSLARISNAVARRLGDKRGYAYWQLRWWDPQLIHAPAVQIPSRNEQRRRKMVLTQDRCRDRKVVFVTIIEGDRQCACRQAPLPQPGNRLRQRQDLEARAQMCAELVELRRGRLAGEKRIGLRKHTMKDQD